MLDKSFWSKDDLLNSKITYDKGTEENAPLWSLQFLLFSRQNQIISSELCAKTIEGLARYMKLCLVGKGIYNQNIEPKNNHDDYTSPDQLIAFICTNKIMERDYLNRDIWCYLVWNLFTYDNIKRRINFKRIMQPMAVLTAAASGSYLRFLFRPILSITCLISCLSAPGETSGKLKALTIVKSFDMKFTYLVMTKVIDGQYEESWKTVFQIYFPHLGHPLSSKDNVYF